MSCLKEGLFTPNYFSFTCHMIKQTRVCSLFRGLWSIAPSFKREEMQTMPTSSVSAHWGHPAGERSGWGPQLESQTKLCIHKQHQPFWDANVPTAYATMQTAQAQWYAQLITWHTVGETEKNNLRMTLKMSMFSCHQFSIPLILCRVAGGLELSLLGRNTLDNWLFAKTLPL